MAYVKFRKDDEPSIKKNYIPNSIKVHTKMKKYIKISLLVNFIQIMTIIFLLIRKN